MNHTTTVDKQPTTDFGVGGSWHVAIVGEQVGRTIDDWLIICQAPDGDRLCFQRAHQFGNQAIGFSLTAQIGNAHHQATPPWRTLPPGGQRRLEKSSLAPSVWINGIPAHH
ncbi:MAG: hypothetical protein ACREYA_02610 [Cupriavidus necator]